MTTPFNKDYFHLGTGLNRSITYGFKPFLNLTFVVPHYYTSGDTFHVPSYIRWAVGNIRSIFRVNVHRDVPGVFVPTVLKLADYVN